MKMNKVKRTQLEKQAVERTINEKLYDEDWLRSELMKDVKTWTDGNLKAFLGVDDKGRRGET